MAVVVLRKVKKIKFRSMAEINADIERAKEEKNRLHEAYAIIEKMNREGKLISEIEEALIGYQNRNFKPFNAQNIKAYLKNKGFRFKSNKYVNTQPRFETIPLERGVEHIDFRQGRGSALIFFP